MELKASIKLFAASLPLLLMFGFAVPAHAQSGVNISGGLCTGANLQFTDNPDGACTSTDATTQINNLIHTIINILSAIVGIVAVIMIIIGGLRYITSGGNDANVASAKNTILYAIIGLIIVALSQLIVRFVLNKVASS